ncbi:MAG: glutamate--tRNA ligase [Acidobacteria bacterium]|jgi:glutamyl-tRNA synthetase|nr:glutamate--tRNA ligase [Acidobacteriota bacterium]
MESTPVRVRFAPSPTGHLHLGNVRTALFNWLFARREGGTFILRIEDTDAERSTQASVDSVLEDLRWLGFDWDEGPEAGGSYGPYRQTERYGLYSRYAKQLLDEGKAYRCYCTQEELDAQRQAARDAGRPFIYPGTCRFLTEKERQEREEKGIKPALRLKVQPKTVAFRDIVRGPVSIHTNAFGDWILVRPDGSPTYNFAVVVDDSLMKISHVIRGEDHLSNTPKQILLYEAFGFPLPQFAHLSMILGPDGSKLSKRHGDVSVDAFREKGFLPQALDNGLALLGWSDPDGIEVFDLSALMGRFGLDRVNKAAAVFDAAKFRHLNREHLKKMSEEELLAVTRPYLERASRLPEGELNPEVKAWALSLAPLLRERMEVLSDAVSATDPLFVFDPASMDDEARAILAEPDASRVIKAFLAKAKQADLARPGAYRALVLEIKDELKVKGKALFHPIRVALTCAASGPELEMLVPMLAAGARLSLPTPILGPVERCERIFST